MTGKRSHFPVKDNGHQMAQILEEVVVSGTGFSNLENPSSSSTGKWTVDPVGIRAREALRSTAGVFRSFGGARSTCLGVPGHPCDRPTSGLRCETCQREFERQGASSRPAVERAIYGSAAYRKLRREVLDAAGWRCFECGRRAVTVHHLLTVRQRPDLGLVRDNLRAACRSCQERLKRSGRPRQVGMFEVLAATQRTTTTISTTEDIT